MHDTPTMRQALHVLSRRLATAFALQQWMDPRLPRAFQLYMLLAETATGLLTPHDWDVDGYLAFATVPVVRRALRELMTTAA